MNKPIKPDITIPESFAVNGVKTDFSNDLLNNGFDNLNPDVLAGDNLNQFIDITYKGLNYGMAAADAINLINEGETLTVIDGKLTSGSSGSSRNIGEFVFSSLPQTDAGLHLPDGALINGNGAYADFVDYIAELYGDGTAIPSYFTTEEEWQTSIVNYGVCGKFVYDSVANTVRLPKATGLIEGTIDINALGELVEAGLPNIKGAVSTQAGVSNVNGVFSLGTANDGGDLGNDNLTRNFIFDASNYNPIYKNDFNKVQPQTIKGFIYICIATSKKNDVEVNINNVMTDVNGKADIDGSNMVASVKNFDGQWISINEVGYQTVYSSTALGTYTIDLSDYLPNDGYNYEIYISGSMEGAATTCAVDLNTSFIKTYFMQTDTQQSKAFVRNSVVLPIGTDLLLTINTAGTAPNRLEINIHGYRRIGTNE